MIVDSNQIILCVKPAYPGLRRLLARSPMSVSIISQVEVLGYHKLPAADQLEFEAIFASVPNLAVTQAIIDQVIVLRQARKMDLGDALIAATALDCGQELYTHNVKDFANIPGLVVIDPIAAGDPP